MAIKAIVFDLWNTLAYNKGSRINPIIMLEKKLGLNMKLYREVELGLMTKRFETKKDAIINLCRHIGVKPKERLVSTLLYLWGDTRDMSFFPEVRAELEKLKRDYKLAVLSNTDCFHTKEFTKNGFDRYFDFTAFSCDLGLLKPDPKIFKAVMQELGVKPGETVMVGDNLKDDVLAAEKLGIRGVLIKRDFESVRAKPSWVETGKHERAIKDLAELGKFL